MEIVNLTLQNLSALPEWETYPFSCKYCLYWEHPEEVGDSVGFKKEDAFLKKGEWLQETLIQFGECGKILYIDGRPVGYAQYAPLEFLPGATGYPSIPIGEDAVLISCLVITDKRFRRLGYGRQLLHSILDDLKLRQIHTVETYARKGSFENPSGPMEFYLKNGFRIQRDDAEFPLLRIDY